MTRLCFCPLCAGDEEGAGGSAAIPAPGADKPVWTQAQITRNFFRQTLPGDLWTKGQTIAVTIPTVQPPTSIGGEHETWVQPNGQLIQAWKDAFAAWDALISLDFVFVEPDEPWQMSMGLSDSPGNAYAYLPLGAAIPVEAWFKTAIYAGIEDPAEFQPGRRAPSVFLHEIGHMLGLSHPGNYSSGDYGEDVLYRQDSQAYTVMSYYSARYSEARFEFADYEPGMPMLHDILAAQSRYGREETRQRVGDTRYGYGASRDVPAALDMAKAVRPIGVVTDDGGRDVLDFSRSSADQRLSLRPGEFSDVLGLQGNLVIQPGSLIESAMAGSGDDRLLGNAVANRLIGGAGDDWLDGRAGADLLQGGPGDDVYVLDRRQDRILGESAGSGRDEVRAWFEMVLPRNLEDLTLLGSARRATGNAAANVLTGTAGSDWLDGRAGADWMRGLGGDDRYVVDSARDRITETLGFDAVQASVTYTLPAKVEALTLLGRAAGGTGNAEANVLQAAPGSSALVGLAGDDRLLGGAGEDRLNGGPGADRLRGGPGADLFLLTADGGGLGLDRVEDFGVGADRVLVRTALEVTQIPQQDGLLLLAGDSRMLLVGVRAPLGDDQLI